MSAYKKEKTPQVSHTHTAPQIGKYRPITDPRALSQGQRKTLWAGIQRNNPALADMLKTDPTIAEFKAQFDAHIVFYTDEAIQYMKD